MGDGQISPRTLIDRDSGVTGALYLGGPRQAPSKAYDVRFDNVVVDYF